MRKKYLYAVESIFEEEECAELESIEYLLREYGEKGYKGIFMSSNQKGIIKKIIFEKEEITPKLKINDVIINSDNISNTLKDKLSLYMLEYNTGNIYIEDINLLQFKSMRNVGTAIYEELIHFLRQLNKFNLKN